ncbi:aldo/keto reductase [Streptomyces sp. NPDC015242]|uniref:aldo/keto reductase n=1 Tax=Streptomyces sp. NPDC015242 TaxID=3364951 RepID=UPI003701C96B
MSSNIRYSAGAVMPAAAATARVEPASLPPSSRSYVDPRWQPGNFGKNVEAVDRLAGLAVAKGATVSQLALAWLLTRGEHIVPIPGTRSQERVEENSTAAELTLTDAGLKAIDEILPQGGCGARYAGGNVPTWI